MTTQWNCKEFFCACGDPQCNVSLYTDAKGKHSFTIMPLYIIIPVKWQKKLNNYILSIYIKTKSFKDPEYRLLTDSFLLSYCQLLCWLEFLLFPLGIITRLVKYIFNKPEIVINVVINDKEDQKVLEKTCGFSFNSNGYPTNDIEYNPKLFSLSTRIDLVCHQYIIREYSKYEDTDGHILEESFSRKD